MDEEQLLEYLGEHCPDWREHYSCPYEAADELFPAGIPDGDAEDYRELHFD